MAEKTEFLQAIDDAILDADSLERFINGDDAQDVLTRLSAKYPTLRKAIKQMFENGGLPATPFKTVEGMEVSDLPDGIYAVVTNDSSNLNGLYYKTNDKWERQTLGYAPDFTELNSKAVDIAKSYTDNNIIPVLVDSDNNVLVGYDSANESPVLAGVDDFALTSISSSIDVNNIPLLVDVDNNILIGYDKIAERPILAGFDNITKNNNSKLTTAEYNHFLFYGQSLSVGAEGLPVLSTNQPYNNLTFDTSPRMDSEPTELVPLVESHNIPSSDGNSNRGETPCSGAANYVSRSLMLDYNILPDDHKIIATTAGKGGTAISNLDKSSAWYSHVTDHVAKAKEFVNGTYKVQVVGWLQGESDSFLTGLNKDQYKSKFIKLCSDMNKDIKAISGQSDDIDVLTYQLSTHARRTPKISTALLESALENDNIHMVTPCYFLPFAGDTLHLSAVGYKWIGAYFGRAYKQRVFENRQPDFLRPVSAVSAGSTIIIKFDSPSGDVVLDVETLPKATDYGLKVVDSSGSEVVITSVSTEGSNVIIELSSDKGVEVRYGYDYLANGLGIMNGGSGNIRDTTDESITIDGVERKLWHWCPHFILNIQQDKGI